MHPRNLMELLPRDPDSGAVNAVVETPANSRNKYRYDEALGLFHLHKVLPLGDSFPFDFGFIPGTRAEDGDALDVLILGEDPTFTGCLVTVRVLGAIEATQLERGRSIRNDRLIATPDTPKIRPVARTLDDLPTRLLDQIEHFFSAYNQAEGRTFTPIARRGPRAAMNLIQRGIRAYQNSRRT